MFKLTAMDSPLPIARKGTDKTLTHGNVTLDFDSGRLMRIQFETGYEYRNALMPYPEPWKNLPAIGRASVTGKMLREDFISYLKLWEERAAAMDSRVVEAGSDLAFNEYSVGIVQETLMDFHIDMIALNMGPSRRAGGGGLWCDGWILTFGTPSDSDGEDTLGRLRSLSAFRDEFNTVARKPTKA